MTIEANIVTWLLDAVGIGKPGRSVTTSAKRRSETLPSRAQTRKRPKPPPWVTVEHLSAHMRRDIGLSN